VSFNIYVNTNKGYENKIRCGKLSSTPITTTTLLFIFQVHFVFYNEKYKSLEMADDKDDGVVAVVLLIEVSQELETEIYITLH